jgi:small subunit ribosomal protein S8
MKKAVTLSTDPIADMLTRVRNAIAINRAEVSMPHSVLKERVAKILVQNNFLVDAKSSKDDSGRKQLQITIAPAGANARITEITRLSRPGRRQYVKVDAIPTVMRGRGIVVVSTSQGVMTGDQARKKNLGGELICKVY